VVNTLNEVGIDPYRDRIPVAPAAHYTMGGIATDLDGGSSLRGLYAVGECACNGLHGANRLASNSLAECFVFGRRAALAGLGEPEPPRAPGAPPAEGPNPVPPRETRAELWLRAGIERTADGLRELLDDPFPLARIIAASALAREESRGAHQRSDFPGADTRFDRMHAVARGDDVPRFERWD
jgi:L-aspartate oxidase